MNPLNRHPRIRQAAYYVQFVVAGAVLLIGVGYAAAETALPTWYAVVAAVTSALWSYLGLTAGRNVDVPPLREPGDPVQPID